MATPAGDRYDWFVSKVLDGTFDEDAAKEGFSERFLAEVPYQRLQAGLDQGLAQILSRPVTGRQDQDLSVEVVYDDMVASARVEPQPPTDSRDCSSPPSPSPSRTLAWLIRPGRWTAMP